MKVLSWQPKARITEMTPEEDTAEESFEGLLDDGFGIREAVAMARSSHPGLDPVFWMKLSGDDLANFVL